METTKDVILALKEVKNEKDLSFDQILTLMEKNGQYLSKATLSRVFAKDSENTGNFRYETLRPIADVLLDIEKIEDNDSADTKAYKKILRLKKDIITELKEELNHEKLKYHEKLEKETKHFNERLAFMSHQIELKDKRIDQLMNSNEKLMDSTVKLLEQIVENNNAS